jgi:hypothetical protein
MERFQDGLACGKVGKGCGQRYEAPHGATADDFPT